MQAIEIVGVASAPSRMTGLSSASVASGAPDGDQFKLLVDVEVGEDVVIHAFTNLYGCKIGARTRIGTFVEVQRGVVIGADCKIQSHSFICDGVEIEDRVFVGHGVVFVNDKLPRATTGGGRLQVPGDWSKLRTVVRRGATIGSGAIVLGGVTIGADAMIGAGAVVSSDVEPASTVAGVPARAVRI